MSTCSTRSWWITQWFTKFGDIIEYSENRRSWEKWERRATAIITFILFLSKSKTKSQNGGRCPMFLPWVLGLVFRAWQFRVISPRRCICKNSLTKQNFRAGSWSSEWKFSQRVAIKGKGQKIYAERKTGEYFQRKTIGFCSNWRHMHFSTHACHRTPWDYVERSGRRKEISPRTSILFSTESEGTDRREKLKQSKGQSGDWCLKKSLVYGWQDEKDSHVIFGIIPCVVVTSLETDAFVAFVALFDMLMVRSNHSARSRKEGTQGAVAVLRERVQGCVSQNSDPMNRILRQVGDLRLNASAGHTVKWIHLVQN